MRTTIVTADDDKGFRAILRGLLNQDESLAVIGETENGDDAVLAVREHHPDLVLLDITMPRCHGFDAARRIKAYRPQTKVVILTVHANYEQAALECGADAFILKKRLGSELLPTIRRLAQTSNKNAVLLLIGNDTALRRGAAGRLRARLDSVVVEECPGSEQEVLAKASALHPLAAVVEWEASGAWIIKCLRGLYPSLGIVALTAAGAERQREAILAAGTDASVDIDRLENDLIPLVAALTRSGARGAAAGTQESESAF